MKEAQNRRNRTRRVRAGPGLKGGKRWPGGGRTPERRGDCQGRSGRRGQSGRPVREDQLTATPDPRPPERGQALIAPGSWWIPVGLVSAGPQQWELLGGPFEYTTSSLESKVEGVPRGLTGLFGAPCNVWAKASASLPSLHSNPHCVSISPVLLTGAVTGTGHLERWACGSAGS